MGHHLHIGVVFTIACCCVPLSIAADFPTGCNPPNAEQRAQMEANLVKTVQVLPNRLALQRVAAEASAKGYAFASSTIAPAADGEEIIGATGAAVAAGMAAAAAVPSAIAIPRAVDNSVEPWFPPTGDQGGESSCVCWAETYYTTTSQIARLRGLDMKKLGRSAARTPHFTYPQVNGGSDSGTWTTSAYLVAQTAGVPSFATWPSGSSFAWPTDSAVWHDALPYRMADSGSIGNMDTAASQALAKQMLADGYILNYATEIFQWQYSTLSDDPNTTADDHYFAAGVPAVRRTICTHLVAGSSGHEMTIVGYDDDIWCDLNGNGVVDPGEKGAFRIINSWGGWQDGGCVWLSYDAIGAASAVTGGPSPVGRQAAFQSNATYWLKARTSYTPKLVAEITATHAQRNQMYLGVGVGAVGSATPSRTWAPSMALGGSGGGRAFDGGTTAVTGTFVVDCSDVLTSPNNYRLFAFMRDGTAGTPGTVSMIRFIDRQTGTVTLPTATTPVGGLPQSMDNGTTYGFFDVPLPADAPPVALNLRRDTHSGTTVETFLNASDPNGRALTYAISTQPAHGTLSGTAPLLSYTPNAGYIGMDSFSYTASNGLSTSTPATITIAVGDEVAQGLVADYFKLASVPATIPDISALPVDLGTIENDMQNYSLSAFAYKSGPFAARFSGFLNIPVTGKYTIVMFSADGARMYIDNKLAINNDGVHGATYKTAVYPSLTAGLHPIRVEYFHGPSSAYMCLQWVDAAGKGGLLPAANLVHYTYTPPPATNTAPVARDVSIAAVSGTGTAYPITLDASDADQNPLTYTTTRPAHGTLFGNPPNLSYVADAGYAGSDAFSYVANDGTAESNLATVTITVTTAGSVNHAPVAPDRTITTATGRPRTFALVASDSDGNALTYSIATQPAHGTVTLSGANATYTPTAGYSGKDAFTYRANDGTVDSAAATVSLVVGTPVPGMLAEFFTLAQSPSVLPVLDGLAPSLTQTDATIAYTDATWPSGMVDNFALRYSGYLSIATAGSYSFRLTSDDGSRLWMDGVKQMDNDGLHGAVSVLKTLTLTAGLHDLRVEYFQGGGGKSLLLEWFSGGKWTTIPTSALVCVPISNAIPVANGLSITISPNALTPITLGGSDSDGDPLTYAIASQPTFGMITGTAPSLTYHPPTGYQGDDSFTFRVSDGRNTSAPATVSIHIVSAANTLPTVALAASVTPSPVSGTSAAVRCLGADDGMEQGLIYNWSTVGTPPATVTFNVNASNAAKSATASFIKAGSYVLSCVITDAGGLTASSTVAVVVAQTPTDLTVTPSTAEIAPSASQQFTALVRDQFSDPMAVQPAISWSLGSASGGSLSASGLFTSNGTTGGPWPLTATTASVIGSATIAVAPLVLPPQPRVALGAAATLAADSRSATLSALGTDDGGEPALTYTWSVSGTAPAGAVFSPNASNAAKNSVVTFAHAGTYTLQCRISDAGGLSTTTAVVVSPSADPTSLVMTPASASLIIGATQQFTSTLLDQFGDALADQSSVARTALVLPCGYFDSKGLFTANTTIGGPYTLTSTTGSLSATASVTVINAAPTVVTAAAAGTNPVIGTTTTLTALGADDGGAALLTYSWSVPATAPATVSFSPNGTTASTSTTATFKKSGSYPITCTIKDRGGLTTTTTVTVTVNQTGSSLSVTPASVTLASQERQQFAAAVFDQFGTALATQPAITWQPLSSTVGALSSTGAFVAGTGVHGSATITAKSGALSGTAAVMVNNPPTISTPVTVASLAATASALSVLGADDAGEGNLTYTWSVSATAPATVQLGSNGSNAAKSTTAAFIQAGTYVLICSVTDAQNRTTSTSVTVVVDQIPTAISLDPKAAVMDSQQTRQFTATVLDQFGTALAAQPAITWTVDNARAGTVTNGGLFTAGAITGTATVTATSGALSTSASVAITAVPPPTTATPGTPDSGAPQNPATTPGTTAAAGGAAGGGGCGLGSGMGLIGLMFLGRAWRRGTRAERR